MNRRQLLSLSAATTLVSGVSNNALAAKDSPQRHSNAPVPSVDASTMHTVASYANVLLTVGITDNQTLEMLGYYEAGDGGGNRFFWSSGSTSAHNGGTVIKPTAILGAGRWIAINNLVANFRQFGARGDGVDDTLAMKAASAFATEQGVNLYAPKGIYTIIANNDTKSGLPLTAPINGTFVLYGDGAGISVIKRKDTEKLAPSSALVWMTPNAKTKYIIKDITFDGNEANCPYEASNAYAHQQSANLRWYGHGANPESLTIQDVDFLNCVADGYLANVVTNVLHINNVKALGRTRRVRCDIQLSRLPTVATNITNCTIDCFEQEPSFNNTTHILNMTNVVVRGAFDIAGDATNLNINFENVKALNMSGVGNNFVNFLRVSGHVSNSFLTNINRIQSCNLIFTNTKFIVGESKIKKNEANSVDIWHDNNGSDGNSVIFNNCSFDAVAAVTTGQYVKTSVATADSSRMTEFNNCITIKKLDYFTAANRCGTMVINGGQLSGNHAVLLIANGGAPNITYVHISNIGLWSGENLIELSKVTGTTQIHMDGKYDAESINLIKNTTAITEDNITWYGNFVGSITSTPDARVYGVPNLIMRKREAVAGDVVEYRYCPTAPKRYAERTYTAVMTL